ncbi:MAG: hypothetical protein HYT70_03460 [Candidatus Aenigmarchaeota archaeon]|nr:hypothetical protein [Candidatus Aenigmarchaeota archaeon]
MDDELYEGLLEIMKLAIRGLNSSPELSPENFEELKQKLANTGLDIMVKLDGTTLQVTDFSRTLITQLYPTSIPLSSTSSSSPVAKLPTPAEAPTPAQSPNPVRYADMSTHTSLFRAIEPLLLYPEDKDVRRTVNDIARNLGYVEWLVDTRDYRERPYVPLSSLEEFRKQLATKLPWKDKITIAMVSDNMIPNLPYLPIRMALSPFIMLDSSEDDVQALIGIALGLGEYIERDPMTLKGMYIKYGRLQEFRKDMVPNVPWIERLPPSALAHTNYEEAGLTEGEFGSSPQNLVDGYILIEDIVRSYAPKNTWRKTILGKANEIGILLLSDEYAHLGGKNVGQDGTHAYAIPKDMEGKFKEAFGRYLTFGKR